MRAAATGDGDLRVLLLALPDHIPYLVAACYPNLGICSLAAHVEGARVRVMDLRLARDVEATVERLMLELDPHVVGVSSMTFQYPSALRIADQVRCLKPSVRTVLGGYHPTVAHPTLSDDRGAPLFDFFVRGEGEATFDRLIQALRCGDDRFDRIEGLSWWCDGQLVDNPLPPLLDLADVRLPARHLRLANGFHGWGERVDVIETSRGCTRPCTFCSMQQMYGHTFRTYDLDRVVEDVLVMRSQGVEKVVVVDDNVTLDVERLKALCRRLIEERIRLRWQMQATVAGIAADEELSALLAEAGFFQVYLGIEHFDHDTQRTYRKGGTPEAVGRAIRHLRKHGIQVFGGFMIGAPEHDRRTIDDLVAQIRALDLDVVHLHMLTPWPGTPLTEDLVARGLVDNPSDFGRYGEHANTRTEHLTAAELQRLRTRAHARLFFDPRTRLGRRFYRHLPTRHVLQTLYCYARQAVDDRRGRDARPPRYRSLEARE